MMSLIARDLRDLLNALADENSKQVFQEILKSRILTKRQLSEHLKGIDVQVIDKSLRELKGVGLIDTKPAAISEWDKYFVTEEGLAAERALR